ncbi:thioredoxin-dependent thiol peroxidase [Patescibacteria group bacterium AH-259-L05]|nr:thioredoxin-dependent thiol peroxidase [Patescibacteria group bacterium AH-259-L05]
MAKLSLGNKAPVFSLLDQNNKKHNLSEYKGTWVLVYFYPRDNTPGCTTEACGIRDTFSQFNKSNAVVLGVSADSVTSHERFANKYNLPFPLLADEDKKAVKAYGVWGKKKFVGKEFMGIKRMSFLIDPDGNIAKIYKTVKPKEHAQQVLNDLKVLRT